MTDRTRSPENMNEYFGPLHPPRVPSGAAFAYARRPSAFFSSVTARIAAPDSVA
jgi:hypothetical protein